MIAVRLTVPDPFLYCFYHFRAQYLPIVFVLVIHHCLVMKRYLFSALPLLVCTLFLQHIKPAADTSPLAEFSNEWNDAKYLKCNTAENTSYLSKDEKDLIYILNLLHTDPKLFANTVVTKYPSFMKQPNLKEIAEYRSLLDTLRKIKSLPLLYPDSLCFESAKCHAISSGNRGYVGHERQTNECKTKKYHWGECCQYGYKEALPILMALLIDQYVPSLGHRFLCLSSYNKIGISIQPHKSYGYNAVLDFH